MTWYYITVSHIPTMVEDNTWLGPPPKHLGALVAKFGANPSGSWEIFQNLGGPHFGGVIKTVI